VTGQQDDDPWVGFPPESADDVLELGDDRPRRRLGPSWWPPQIPPVAMILAAATLILGLGVGFGVGHAAGSRQSGRPAATASDSTTSAASVASGDPVLAQTGNVCSAQQGDTLQLGIQVANDSAAPLTLGQVRAVLPMGGLQMTGWTWGPCGELNAGPHNGGDPQGSGPDQYLTPGANGWINVEVKVMVTCPNPLPVQFVVSYEQHGKLGTVQFPGFQDLGAVPYSGCPGT
jgi:hypothetical protein